MNLRSGDHLVEMAFSGHKKIVELTFFRFQNGPECRCRMTWSDAFTELWLHLRAKRWKFKTRKSVPPEILNEEPVFDRVIKILYHNIDDN